MKSRIFLALMVIAIPFCVSAKNLVGTWSGELKVSLQMSLKLVFHVNEDSSVMMDSPDQGAFGIPTETVYLSSDSINLKVSKLMMSYSGRLADNQIDGTFQQGGLQLPLILKSGEQKANRPQTPVGPFPYSTEEVTVSHDDVTLGGTLTIPENAGKNTPVVVMVTGSGQQNRDEELFEHKPFAVIADFLAKNGIASLRYDDRGVGASIGEVTNATTTDYAQDAECVVKYIRDSKRFGKIGLLGHSEGGMIAYMLGAKPKMLDFIVSLAGSAVRGDSIIVYQNCKALANAGITGQIADNFCDALREAYKIKIDTPEAQLSNEELAKIYPSWNDNELTRTLANNIIGLFGEQAPNTWLQYFIAYSPANDLRRLKIPALLIYGEKDMQVPASMNARVAQQLAPTATVKVYPYANHLMQHATSGQIDEYKTIEETISPEILADITTFIKVNGTF